MKKVSRRRFVEQLGVGVSAAAFLPSVAFSAEKQAPLYAGKKLQVALCGLGRYANLVREGLAASQYCQLAGIVTGTPAKAAAWRTDHRIPEKNVYSYQNFDKILTNKAIDAVYITLPNALHKEFTLRAARAGKHVIVEKPMALTEQDCQEMIAACKKAGVQLAVGYRLHYEPHHQEIKRLGQEKVFGQVRLIESSLGYRLAGISPDDWHLKKALAGGGPLMNLGVYCVQSSRYVLGEEPVAVTAQFGPVTMPELFKEVEESISWQLTFPSGAVCTSTTTSTCNIDRFFASADNGSFELSPGLSYGPFQGKSSQGAFNFPVLNQQAAQLDGIAPYLLEDKPLPAHISGEEGRKDLRVLDAIYKAARSGEKVTLR
ncbi:Gfo/Idh/MocA family oxidoreductase [Hymenobacter sp. 5516J-16]|uniref:Gfo/Idh/MocA family protein n=1 Tax=Hymenobacter sp. 5516J-16 TaxID=2932253 RepID=UPI001FD041AC|nr:Gfo/Idh/MocA family oxidoreductase [Hymenobacter sp. 5516J-16]UOQ77770.1 Gfo/Idh/MocA family oxidoreductase [Hymenobacter sp. 5516J-16]